MAADREGVLSDGEVGRRDGIALNLGDLRTLVGHALRACDGDGQG